MRKKYSDPLMFPSVLLSGIGMGESDNGGQGPDVEVPLRAGRLAEPKLNAAPAEEVSDSVTIVNPAEETGNNTGSEAVDMFTGDTSSLEAESVINMIAPDETTTPSEAGE